MKELLTASRSAKFLSCPRAHFWSYERRLRREDSGPALRFGSAWHRAMEARWKGHAAEDCLSLALPEGVDLDAIQAETLASLLLVYFRIYGAQDELIAQAFPEVEFKQDLKASRSFYSAGKIDGLVKLSDGRFAIIEHKTTSDDVSEGSDYWTRLRFNPQLLQYVGSARQLGWPVETAIYDVTRKPMIQPRQIPLLDEQGCKIVNDAAGNRVYKKDGSPRESADTANGYVLQTRIETPEEFGQRLFADANERPGFYFARREVPILDQDLDEFAAQRITTSRMILGCRAEERRLQRQEQAWPRNVGQACGYCEYAQFCLQNITPDLNQPPAGFRVGEQNPELTNADSSRTTTTN
jgi:hypothetical protein